jgi:hypothetical protein
VRAEAVLVEAVDDRVGAVQQPVDGQPDRLDFVQIAPERGAGSFDPLGTACALGAARAAAARQ